MEPSNYESAREELRVAERDLMLQRETVAQMRRDLPEGPEMPDYVFGSTDGHVKLSELFTNPEQPLVLYHFMYGKAQTGPCPMCSMWTDGWAAVDNHLAQNINFALVSAASPDDTAALAKERGWESLRWVSSADNTFKIDVGGENDEGHQWPFISVYEKEGDSVRLSYSGSAHIEGDHWRGVDLLSPVWHFLDLTRQGRGDWNPSLSY